jgi:hypothetical protein
MSPLFKNGEHPHYAISWAPQAFTAMTPDNLETIGRVAARPRDSGNDSEREIDLLVMLLFVLAWGVHSTLTVTRLWQCEESAREQHWSAEQTAACREDARRVSA